MAKTDKLDAAKVAEARDLRACGAPAGRLAERYGVSGCTMTYALNMDHWPDVRPGDAARGVRLLLAWAGLGLPPGPRGRLTATKGGAAVLALARAAAAARRAGQGRKGGAR